MLSKPFALRTHNFSPLITPGAVVGTPRDFTLIAPSGFAGLRPHRGSFASRASHPAPAVALGAAFRERRVRRMGRRFHQGIIE